jgi:hypothetical protein
MPDKALNCAQDPSAGTGRTSTLPMAASRRSRERKVAQ